MIRRRNLLWPRFFNIFGGGGIVTIRGKSQSQVFQKQHPLWLNRWSFPNTHLLGPGHEEHFFPRSQDTALVPFPFSPHSLGSPPSANPDMQVSRLNLPPEVPCAAAPCWIPPEVLCCFLLHSLFSRHVYFNYLSETKCKD